MKIPVKKTETIALVDENSVQTRITLDNKTLEQVSHLHYLGCDIAYDIDHDVD